MGASIQVPEQWRTTLVAVVALLLFLVAVFHETAWQMVSIWYRSDTFAHGFLIVPISIYLVWRQADRLKQLTPQASAWGLPGILAASLLWWVAEVSGTAVIAQFAFTALIPLVVLTLVGGQVAKLLWFPLVYLLFAVPAGEGLIQPMMDFTAVFTVKAIELTGIPVYWEGRYIAIPKGNFEVAEACSGVRYLIASVALGALYGHLTYRSLWRQGVFLLFAILVPIIANGFRAYGIVMIAHLSDMKLAVGADHLVYGWLFFGLVMFILFGIGSIWQENVDAYHDEVGATEQTGRLKLSLPALLPLIVAMVVSGPILANTLSSPEDGLEARLAELQPVGDWRIKETPSIPWEPRFVGIGAERRLTLDNGEYTVEVYLGIYGQQRQGAELLNFANRFYDPDRWLRLDEKPIRVDLAGTSMEMNEIHLQRGGTRGMLWHQFEIAGVTTTNPIVAKLLGAWNRLVVGSPSRILAVYADYDLREGEARERLRNFLRDNRQAIERALDATAQGKS